MAAGDRQMLSAFEGETRIPEGHRRRKRGEEQRAPLDAGAANGRGGSYGAKMEAAGTTSATPPAARG